MAQSKTILKQYKAGEGKSIPTNLTKDEWLKSKPKPKKKVIKK